MHIKDLSQGLANNHEQFQQEGDLAQWLRMWVIDLGRIGQKSGSPHLLVVRLLSTKSL